MSPAPTAKLISTPHTHPWLGCVQAQRSKLKLAGFVALFVFYPCLIVFSENKLFPLVTKVCLCFAISSTLKA